MVVVVDRLLLCLAARVLCSVGRKKLLRDRYISADEGSRGLLSVISLFGGTEKLRGGNNPSRVSGLCGEM